MKKMNKKQAEKSKGAPCRFNRLERTLENPDAIKAVASTLYEHLTAIADIIDDLLQVSEDGVIALNNNTYEEIPSYFTIAIKAIRRMEFDHVSSLVYRVCDIVDTEFVAPTREEIDTMMHACDTAVILCSRARIMSGNETFRATAYAAFDNIVTMCRTLNKFILKMDSLLLTNDTIGELHIGFGDNYESAVTECNIESKDPDQSKENIEGM